MADFWERLETIADRPFTSVERAFLLSVMAFAATAAVLLSRESLSVLSSLGASAVVSAAVFVGTFFLLRGPRASIGATGILVALSPEDEAYGARLRADFVQQLRHTADSGRRTHRIQIIDYPASRSKAITDVTAAERELVRTRCQVAIFGEARVRSLQGKQKHVITPRLLIRHRPIPQTQSDQFGQALSRVFPRRFIIDAEGDFILFALASSMVLAAAQYAIGVAAILALDLDWAEELFEQLRVSTAGLPREQPPASHLRSLAEDHLAHIHRLRALRAHWRWNETRNKAHLMESEIHIDKLLTLRPHDEPGLLGKAIAGFVLRRDVGNAWRCITKCRSSPTATWRYSEAFLNLYRGALDRARAAYRKAVRAPTNELSDYLQSEQFILEVLQEEPDRYWLWFGVGAINALVKEDLDGAREAFAKFREFDRGNKYGVYHAWGEEQIARLESLLPKSESPIHGAAAT